MPFLSHEALQAMGFKSLGHNVLISDRASIYGAARISLGDHTRIDDFCIISAGEGGIEIGRYVHLACYVSIIGAGRVVMEDFSGCSSRVAIYSSNDDYLGNALTNPCVPPEYTNVSSAPVHIGRHAIIGATCVILPGVTIGEGSAVGALTLVSRNLEPWGIYAGTPPRRIKDRSKALLEKEKQLEADMAKRGQVAP